MTAKGKTTASAVQVGDRIIVVSGTYTAESAALWSWKVKEGDSYFHESRTKTGEGVHVVRVTGKTFRPAQGRYERQGKYVIETSEGTFEAAGVQTMWLAPEDAAGVKRAHAEALTENVRRNREVTPERRAAAHTRAVAETTAATRTQTETQTQTDRRDTMKLTRKDYETIAETIRNLPADPTREAVALAFTDMLVGTNPRFDRSRFFAAATRPLDGTELVSGTRYPKVHDPYNTLPVKAAGQLKQEGYDHDFADRLENGAYRRS